MITLARVQAEAAKAVAEMGRDFRYNESGGVCRYRVSKVGESNQAFGFDEDFIKVGDPKTLTPCIIGRMLESMHLMNDRIRQCSTSVQGLFGEGGEYPRLFNYDAVTYMQRLQSKQDGFGQARDAYTWGECYDYAEAEVTRRGSNF